MQAKEILKELVKFDTYKDKENQDIMNYIQGNLEEKGFKVDYRSKCLIMSIKEKCKVAFIGHRKRKYERLYRFTSFGYS